MAFPNTPTDGQVSQGYKYNSALNLWEKIEVSTNPPANPVGYWSFDETYRYPNDPSGVVYLQDEWATTDGWTQYDNGITYGATLSVADGSLIATVDADRTAMLLMKHSSFGTNKAFVARVKSSVSGTVTLNYSYGGVNNYTLLNSEVIAGQWKTLAGSIAEDVTRFDIRQAGISPGDTLEVDFLYVGNGSYLSKAMDSSGQANHGTLVGGPVFVPGKAGQAASFNGVGDYVNVGNSNVFEFGINDFAISFFVKPLGNSSNNTPAIVMKRTSVSLGYSVYYSETSNKLSGVAAAGFGGESNTIVPLNEWSNIVVCRENETTSLYVNGVFDRSAANSINANSLNNLYLGFDNLNNRWFDGLIDEVRIYNRALSAEEVWTLYVLPDKKKNMMPPSKALSHFPENATTGTEIYRTDLSQLFIYTGLEWIQV